MHVLEIISKNTVVIPLIYFTKNSSLQYQEQLIENSAKIQLVRESKLYCMFPTKQVSQKALVCLRNICSPHACHSTETETLGKIIFLMLKFALFDTLFDIFGVSVLNI